MDRLLARLPPQAGVVFLRLRSLGDTLLLTPAAAALKAWRPDLRLAVVVESRFAAVVAQNPDFSAVIETAPGAAGRWRALRVLRQFRPQLTLGLHGGTTAAALVRASGARYRASFQGLRHGWAYNLLTPPEAPPPPRRRLHTVEHVGSLLRALGLPPAPLGPLRLLLRPEARSRTRRHLAQRGVHGPYAFLSTEAREPGLRWPLEHFAALAAWLRQNRGLSSVQASSSAGEPVAGAVLFSGTSIEELAALEAEAALVIGNDGGPIHIAAALQIPALVLYSSTDIEVWHPWQAPARWLQRQPLAALPLEEVTAALTALSPL
ncbi:MAG: glycosyltransferase family 9 protein [Terriglobales bacterium]